MPSLFSPMQEKISIAAMETILLASAVLPPARHAEHAAVAGLGGYDARHMGAVGAVEGHFVGAVQIAIASERLEGHLARLHVGPNDLAASAHIEGALQIGMADRSARIEHSHSHGLDAAPEAASRLHASGAFTALRYHCWLASSSPVASGDAADDWAEAAGSSKLLAT